MLIYRTDKEGQEFIQHLESCRLQAYLDKKGVGGKWTICYGLTFYPGGKAVKEGDIISSEECDNYFLEILSSFEINIQKYLKGIELNQHQINALVSFTWNAGIKNFSNSTLLKVIKINPNNFEEIEKQFNRWIYDDGVIVDGLINRRKSEAYLYVNGIIKYF